jgi:hypothetical protein
LRSVGFAGTRTSIKQNSGLLNVPARRATL